MPDPIPLPDSVPNPLPEFLHRRHVLRLFNHWNIGSEWYLRQLVENGTLHRIMRRPLKNNQIYKTSEVLGVYKSTKASFTRSLLANCR